MPWITRGLRDGIVTTRYPRRRDGYGPSFRATVRVKGRDAARPVPAGELAAVAACCPTAAFEVGDDEVGDDEIRLDRGRCITCARCVEAWPELFDFDPDFEVATLGREALVVPERPVRDEDVARMRYALAARVRVLRRSVHLRHVDCGSDGSEEWEIAALTNPIYDVQRLGIYFTASPRHADLLLVTGSGAAGMIGALKSSYASMPLPTIVVAVGTDAISGGLYGGSYATRGGVCAEVPVDVFVPGSPPSPFSILHGILVGLGLLEPRGEAS